MADNINTHSHMGSPQPPVIENHVGAASNSGGGGTTLPPTTITRRRNNPQCCANLCRRCVPEFLRDRYERQYFFLVVMTNPVWRFLMCLCILLLLFGSQVQNLWCDPSYDAMFDILYTIAFGVFLVDIAMRILVVPGYIGFKYKTLMNLLMRRCRKKRKNDTRRGRDAMVNEDRDRWSNIHIGSFLFWCDVVSTCSILYEISYINKMQTDVKAADIHLDSFGIPVRYVIACLVWLGFFVVPLW